VEWEVAKPRRSSLKRSPRAEQGQFREDAEYVGAPGIARPAAAVKRLLDDRLRVDVAAMTIIATPCRSDPHDPTLTVGASGIT
jgi:hypothetical protein